MNQVPYWLSVNCSCHQFAIYYSLLVMLIDSTPWTGTDSVSRLNNLYLYEPEKENQGYYKKAAQISPMWTLFTQVIAFCALSYEQSFPLKKQGK